MTFAMRAHHKPVQSTSREGVHERTCGHGGQGGAISKVSGEVWAVVARHNVLDEERGPFRMAIHAVVQPSEEAPDFGRFPVGAGSKVE